MLKYQKTERQLLLYIFLDHSWEVEMRDLMRRLDASKKTIQRDIADLTDAGLIKVKYSRKDKSYKKEEPSGAICEPEGTRRYQHLKKLRRLAIFMEELSGYEDFIPDKEFGEQYNCRERYFELFPEVSERTRMRDYETLSKIGYSIWWDNYEQSHRISIENILYDFNEF